MQYQDNDYITDTDAAPWTAAPSAQSAQMVAAPRNGNLVPAPAGSAVSMSDMLAFGSLIQSVQQAQTQQMYLLRDVDARLARLEDHARYPAPAAPAPAPSYERATWWAIWGLLMLILGGALALVTLLILLNVQFR